MFKIGEFSRLGQVPAATLRFYDEVGLLKPMQVDDYTGYRYYISDQLPRLNRILALKDRGFSLEQIAQLLDDAVPAAHFEGMLRHKRAELQRRVEDEHARLARVEARLRDIALEDMMPTYETELKAAAALTVATVRTVVPAHRTVDWLFDELRDYLGQHGVLPDGPAIAIWHDRHPLLEVEVAVPINPQAGAMEWTHTRISVEELPAVETMATTTHNGTASTLGHAYRAVQTWSNGNGYVQCGPYREVLVQPGATPNDQAAVIELQVPVVPDERVALVRPILAPEELAQLSERSKQVLAYAAEEARVNQHAYIGTEHLFLGLIGVGQGFAGHVLRTFGISVATIRNALSMAPSISSEPMQRQELNDQLRQVFAYAREEARQHGHDYIGTEHLLLGLLREREGTSFQLLMQLGIAPEQVHSEVLHLLEQPQES